MATPQLRYLSSRGLIEARVPPLVAAIFFIADIHQHRPEFSWNGHRCLQRKSELRRNRVFG